MTRSGQVGIGVEGDDTRAIGQRGEIPPALRDSLHEREPVKVCSTLGLGDACEPTHETVAIGHRGRSNETPKRRATPGSVESLEKVEIT